jgi:hypothetical protein
VILEACLTEGAHAIEERMLVTQDVVTTTGMSHRHELLMLETGYTRLRLTPMSRSAVIDDRSATTSRL